MKRFSNIKIVGALAVLIAIFYVATQTLGPKSRPIPDTTCRSISTLIDDGQVSTAVISDRIQELSGVLSDGTQYRLKFPREFTDELTVELTQAFTAD